MGFMGHLVYIYIISISLLSLLYNELWLQCKAIRRPDVKNSLGVVIYKALCFDVAQGRMNGAPNETRTHSCRFASLAC